MNNLQMYEESRKEVESKQCNKSIVVHCASFPKDRPVCCGKPTYAAGGTVGEVLVGSVRYWRCEICGQEYEDIAS